MVTTSAPELTSDQEVGRSRHFDVAIVCALALERAAVQRLLRNCRPVSGIAAVWQGELGKQSVCLIQCGIGEQQAQQCLKHCLSQFDVQRILICGLSGSLTAELPAGRVVAVAAVEHATGGERLNCEALPFPTGEGSALAGQTILLTVTTPLLTTQEKQLCGKQSQAALVDMETYALVKLAREQKKRIAVLRVIGDDVHTDVLPASLDFLADTGDIRYLPIIQHLFWHPFDLATLLKMQRITGIALKQLCDCLSQLEWK